MFRYMSRASMVIIAIDWGDLKLEVHQARSAAQHHAERTAPEPFGSAPNIMPNGLLQSLWRCCRFRRWPLTEHAGSTPAIDRSLGDNDPLESFRGPSTSANKLHVSARGSFGSRELPLAPQDQEGAGLLSCCRMDVGCWLDGGWLT